VEGKLEELRGQFSEESGRRHKEVNERHAKLLIQEEAYWKQRAKMHWLKEGDLNTKFFHMLATSRRRRKKVSMLVNEEGEEVSTQQSLCELVQKYFDELFKPSNGTHEPMLRLIRNKISPDDNERLMAPITREELKDALFHMHPDKAPGPDGFNPTFFEHFWSMCGDDIFTAVTLWLDRGYFPTSLNDTNI
jgi:hypothetical protein